MTRLRYVLLVLPLLPIAGGLWTVARRDLAAPPGHAALVIDRSSSVGEVACTALPEEVQRLRNNKGMRAGSTVLVLATGDAHTADEPVLVGRYMHGRVERVLEGRGLQAKREGAALTDLQAACRRLGTSTREPVLLAARRAVEHLRGLGCGEGVSCALQIITDGEVPEFAPRSKVTPAPVVRINNTGIATRLCGMSQTRGQSTDGRRLTLRRTPLRAQALAQAWQAQFVAPITQEPFCAPPSGGSDN